MRSRLDGLAQSPSIFTASTRSLSGAPVRAAKSATAAAFSGLPSRKFAFKARYKRCSCNPGFASKAASWGRRFGNGQIVAGSRRFQHDVGIGVAQELSDGRAVLPAQRQQSDQPHGWREVACARHDFRRCEPCQSNGNRRPDVQIRVAILGSQRPQRSAGSGLIFANDFASAQCGVEAHARLRIAHQVFQRSHQLIRRDLTQVAQQDRCLRPHLRVAVASRVENRPESLAAAQANQLAECPQRVDTGQALGRRLRLRPRHFRERDACFRVVLGNQRELRLPAARAWSGCSSSFASSSIERWSNPSASSFFTSATSGFFAASASAKR